MPQQLKPEVAV